MNTLRRLCFIALAGLLAVSCGPTSPELEGQLIEMQAQIAEMEAEATDAESRIANANAVLSQLTAQITNLDASINDANLRVLDLESGDPVFARREVEAAMSNIIQRMAEVRGTLGMVQQAFETSTVVQ